MQNRRSWRSLAALAVLIVLSGCAAADPRAAQIVRASGFPMASPPCTPPDDTVPPEQLGQLGAAYSKAFLRAFGKEEQGWEVLKRALGSAAGDDPSYLLTGLRGTTFRTAVRLVLASDGQLQAVELRCTSGIPQLDAEALRAVRAATWPPPPAALLGDDGTLGIFLDVVLRVPRWW